MSLGSIYDTNPDDGGTKEVFLQVSGPGPDRHVLLWWRNTPSAAQVIQLSGTKGSYAYVSPLAFPLPSPSSSSTPGIVDETRHQQILLGKLTKSQRDQILQLAKDVRFERTWVVNGPRVWIRDLLLAMVGVGLVPLAWFTRVDGWVPLVKRRPE